MTCNSSTRRSALKTLGLGAAALSVHCVNAAPPKQPNVLFIAVDDLRPQLGCYGHRQMQSPNIDRLASQGILFQRAYCNVPVCGASRASLLTGLRPHKKRFLNFATWADKDAPGITSLPKHFLQNGYHTISNGKIYHHAEDGAGSWSEDVWRPEGESWYDYQTEENRRYDALDENKRGLPYEKADVPDIQYYDGKIADKAIADLRRMKDLGKPFFLATGFLKPHLPFNAPSKYWDLYRPEDIDLADNPFPPVDAPASAIHNFGELRAYYGIPADGPVPDDMARKLVHGYYACVSYTDAQIGRVLDELDRLGLRDNTIVILWGDHGWNLGEHTLWCKHCNFNTSLQSTMMLSVPGRQQGLRTRALVEYVDIYPTLCDLCSLPLPEHLQGVSMVPLLDNPDRPWKEAVFSRWVLGDSIRTDRYLYTEWSGRDSDEVTGRMLYDHWKDPQENVNIAGHPDNEALVARLSHMLHDDFRAAKVSEL